MDTMINPTAAELEMIRIERERKGLEDQENLVKLELSAEKYLKDYIESVQNNLKCIEKNNLHVQSAYNVFVENGIEDLITLRVKPFTCSGNGYSNLTEEQKESIGPVETTLLDLVVNINNSCITVEDNKTCGSWTIVGNSRKVKFSTMAKKIAEYVANLEVKNAL